MPGTDLKSRVENALRNEVAPALELDGTGIEVLDVSNGVVQLRLTGACSGCPATIWTLIQGIEHEVATTTIPEVEYLEAVS